jgi:uncharacterized C2H2 Zn-finger protein
MTRQSFPCQECGSIFETREQLEQHIAQEHPHQYEAQDQFRCPICGAVFESQARLDLHNQHHHKPASKANV